MKNSTDTDPMMVDWPPASSERDEAMDQFSAHLDRAWDLIQRGDTRGAEASARQALELDPQSPEAYNLLGYVTALNGEALEAIEHYRQAIALDDTFLDAMLNAAELYIHPLRDFDAAIALCEQALSVCESPEESTEALLLSFDAMLGKGDIDGARSVVKRLPQGPYASPHHCFLVGRAIYEIGELERAAPLIEQATRESPTNAEAWYYLGLIRDESGNARGATECFLRVRELDLADQAPPWMSPKELFLKAVQSARNHMDPVFGRFVREAVLLISEVPGIELVADGVDPRALLLLDDLACIENPGPPCGRIFVYQRNVERAAGSPERLEQVLQDALEREITATFLDSPASSEQPDSVRLN